MRTLTAPDYLQNVLGPDLQQLCEQGFPFYAYAVLCQGIELVGNLFDTRYDFDRPGESENRFKRGLKEIFVNQKYAKLKRDFYEGVRGSLIHQLRPGDAFVLGSSSHGASAATHLTEDNEGRIILIIEELVSEFQYRVRIILADGSRARGMLNPKKLTETFIVTSNKTAADVASPRQRPTESSSPDSDVQLGKHHYTYKLPDGY